MHKENPNKAQATARLIDECAQGYYEQIKLSQEFKDLKAAHIVLEEVEKSQYKVEREYGVAWEKATKELEKTWNLFRIKFDRGLERRPWYVVAPLFIKYEMKAGKLFWDFIKEYLINCNHEKA